MGAQPRETMTSRDDPGVEPILRSYEAAVPRAKPVSRSGQRGHEIRCEQDGTPGSSTNGTGVPPGARRAAGFARAGELGDKTDYRGNHADPPEVNESFAAERGVHYELLRDPDLEFTNAVGITNSPVTLFVDADGTISHQTGVLSVDELRDDATELLG